MLVGRWIIWITVALMMLLFKILGVSLAISSVITILLCIIIFVAYNSYHIKKRIKLLDEECDPEAFLELTEKDQNPKKQRKRYINILEIDKSAAFICMGKYDEAKNCLREVDKKYLSKYTGSLLVYYLNWICVYYSTGDIEAGNAILEDDIVTMNINNKRIECSIQLLLAERYYIRENYEACMNKLEEVKKRPNLSTRQKLGVIFTEGQCYLATDQQELAKKRFLKVIKHGNKLHTVALAKEYMLQIEQ